LNYLAHAYLSFNHEEILLGNLISDFVKGKKKLEYSEGIQKGITLHRAIDNFTDTHPVTKKAKDFFRPCYRLYSGAFIDVVYDHFLANDEKEFTEVSLRNFAEQVYTIIDPHVNHLPGRFARTFPYMKMQNWLYNYRSKWGTERSFEGVVRRAAYLTESDTASSLFEEYYKELEQCYREFFPDLKLFARHLFDEIVKL
jgi:acyl carrier protein phosphodiesterase